MNFEAEYRSKLAELEDLQKDYDEFKEMTKMIESELEEQVESWKMQFEALEIESEEKMLVVATKLEDQKSESEFLIRELERCKEKLEDAESRASREKKKRIDAENIADSSQQEMHLKDAMIEDLKAQLNEALEKMTIIEIDAQEVKEFGQDEKQELLQKLRDLQDDIDHRKRRSLMNLEE